MEEKSLSSKVYDNIKKDIIYLKYMPGAILKERELAEEIGVSRTPVREALQRLSQESWVLPSDGKGVYVRNITIEDAYELKQVRLMLELAAVDHVILNNKSRPVAGQLDAIVSNMHGIDNNQKFMMLDMEFHTVLISSMDNHRISRFWNTIQEEVIRMGLVAMRESLCFSDVISEHDSLVNALWNKDTALIKETIKKHINHCYSSIFIGLE